MLKSYQSLQGYVSNAYFFYFVFNLRRSNKLCVFSLGQLYLTFTEYYNIVKEYICI